MPRWCCRIATTSLALAALLLVILGNEPVLLARGQSCTNTCVDCRYYQGHPFCILCVNGYATDYATYQCSRIPSWPTPCSVSNCVQCVLNNPNYCYTCAAGYWQVDQTFKCVLRPTTTTPAPPTTTTTTTTTTTAAPTTTTTGGPATTKAPTTTTTTTTTTTAAPTTTTTTSAPTTTTTTTTTQAPCNVLYCDTCSSGDASVCTQCSSGFELTSANKCEAAGSCFVAGCAACTAGNSSTCTSCRAGFRYLSPTSCENTVASINGAAVVRARVWLAVAGVLLCLLCLLPSAAL